MGTNYAVMEEVRCENCGHKQLTGHEERHIGKSSAGWCFSLRVYTEEEDGINLTSWAEWEEYLKDKVIKDEYGKVIPFTEFESTVTKRMGKPAPYFPWTDDELAVNHAVAGPNNLVRHRIDSGDTRCLCIAHGEGTWDLLKGEFS